MARPSGHRATTLHSGLLARGKLCHTRVCPGSTAAQVDQQGHATGPASSEVKDKLRYVDDFAKSVYDMLQQRNLTDIVDVIFVSDHGMTQTANERLVYLDEVLGEDGFAGIAHKEGWPSCGLRFKEGVDEEVMVSRMKRAAAASEGGFAYYDHATMPQGWHFSGSPRIAPHWLVPECVRCEDKRTSADLSPGWAGRSPTRKSSFT